MKHLIACCSDTHGTHPPDIVSEGVEVLLHAGDVYDRGDRKTPGKNEDVERWRSGLKVPVHAVRGNHDCSRDADLFKSCDIGGCATEIVPGLLVVGVGFAGDVFYELPGERDLAVVCDAARDDLEYKRKDGDQVIVLTHYPALMPELFKFDGNPEGWMFGCVRNLIDDLRPLAVIQGHVHELFGTRMVFDGGSYRSLVVFPGRVGGVLTVDPADRRATFDAGPRGPAAAAAEA